MAAKLPGRARKPPPHDWAPAAHRVSLPTPPVPESMWKFEPPWSAPNPHPATSTTPAGTGIAPRPAHTTPARHKKPGPSPVAPVPGVTITTVFSSTSPGGTSAGTTDTTGTTGASSGGTGSTGLLLLAGAGIAGYLLLKHKGGK